MKPASLDVTDRPHRLRLYGQRPQGASVPLVLHFHGGHFDAGDLDNGRVVAQMLADAGALVASIDYPLAPAHPFPAAAEAGYEALAWLQRQRSKLAGAGSTLWVAGEEAGGNLAAAVAMMARDRHEPPLAGQILLSPMLDPCLATASLRRAEAGKVGCRWADGWHHYFAGRVLDGDHPYAAPARASRLADLPPTLLVTAHDDPLRDETRHYAKRLRAAGVAVQEVTLAGPTGWPCSFMDPACGSAAWTAELNEPLRRLLATTPTPTSSIHAARK